MLRSAAVARRLMLMPAALAVLAVSACADAALIEPSAATSASRGTGSAALALEGELRIAAAASLAAAFEDIAAAFEAEHPGIDVRLISTDGSSTLATQIIEGAPADVFASADEVHMQRVRDAGLASGGDTLATNTLVIAVPTGNSAGVAALADLGEAARIVVLCDAAVPCGRASAELLELADVDVEPASLEQSVAAVLTKVAAGEADAGLVYASDVVRRVDVEAIVPTRAGDVVTRPTIAALEAASNPVAARAFVAYVLEPRGQAILAEHGFGPR